MLYRELIFPRAFKECTRMTLPFLYPRETRSGGAVGLAAAVTTCTVAVSLEFITDIVPAALRLWG
jgi:hypothetical protein